MEDSIPFKVLVGSTGDSFSIKPKVGGNIVGCIIYLNNDNQENPQMVTAGLDEASGKPIAKMQPIQNFRSRDVEYAKDGKPIRTQGGSLLTLNIASRAAFTADLYGYIVFIYEDQAEKCEY